MPTPRPPAAAGSAPPAASGSRASSEPPAKSRGPGLGAAALGLGCLGVAVLVAIGLGALWTLRAPATPTDGAARWLPWAAAGAVGLLGLGGAALVAVGVWMSWARRPAPRRAPAASAPVSTLRPGPAVHAPPAPVDEDPPEPGFYPFSIGPYRCFGRVGEGGMGVVYRARHQALGRLSAVKVLPPHVASQPLNVAWFQREARLAARIQHPNVVGVYDCGTLDGPLHYLAMELVSGRPLTRFIEPRGMDLRAAEAVLRQVAAGLDAAHAAGVIHRDLKPDNILVESDNGRMTAKLVDFGIARPRGEATETAGAVIVGTAPYMSPEQARGEPDLDGRTDIFSLGVVAYELLTGGLPWGSPSDPFIQTVLARGQLDGAPPSARTRRDELPAAVDRALARALAPERAQRPATASAFAHELSRAMSGR